MGCQSPQNGNARVSERTSKVQVTPFGWCLRRGQGWPRPVINCSGAHKPTWHDWHGNHREPVSTDQLKRMTQDEWGQLRTRVYPQIRLEPGLNQVWITDNQIAVVVYHGLSWFIQNRWFHVKNPPLSQGCSSAVSLSSSHLVAEVKWGVDVVFLWKDGWMNRL